MQSSSICILLLVDVVVGIFVFSKEGRQKSSPNPEKYNSQEPANLDTLKESRHYLFLDKSYPSQELLGKSNETINTLQ